MAKRILVIEDEADLVDTLLYSLRRAGFEAQACTDGRSALDRLRRDPLPDLVLLDLMLPDLSGTEICRQLRGNVRTQQLPVIMVTARGAETDRVVGFELGADDYVVKPFSVRELLLRIRAVLRRAESRPAGSETELELGRVRLHLGEHRTWVDDEERTLTALEFRLLATLMRRKGLVQSRERLLSDVWGIDAPVCTRTVDTHVKRLREKLGPASDAIETLRGVGYRFRAEED